MKRLLTGLALIALVAGCAVDTSPDASPDAVAAAAFRAPGPKKLTVITMINNRTGKGGHTALLVNGSQQVIFEKFSRLSDHRAAGGAGLGLAISREVMQRLGGAIAYLPGQGGAAFRVTLPDRRAEAA